MIARLRHASIASGQHFALSTAVALLVAAVVFGVWYPYPYRQISGGQELFFLVVSVDAVAGPLLTLFVFNAAKPRAELWRDMAVIVLLQLCALAYGLYSVYQARPVVLAFEGNRFRAVSAAEIDHTLLVQAPGDLGVLPKFGPRLIGTRLAQPTDADFVQSIKESMDGNPPAMRPSRWLPFDQQRLDVTTAAKPLSALRSAKPSAAPIVDEAVRNAKLPIDMLGYVPLQSRTQSEWIVVVNRENGFPAAYAPVDGW
jgi:hypothetical protein